MSADLLLRRASSAPATAPAPQRISARNDDLQHWYCCDPNVSWCGRDISDVPEEDFDEASCVVCQAMQDGPPCSRCGE